MRASTNTKTVVSIFINLSTFRPPSKDIVYEVNDVRARIPIPK